MNTYYTKAVPLISPILNGRREWFVAHDLKYGLKKYCRRLHLHIRPRNQGKIAYVRCFNNLTMAIKYKREGNIEYIQYFKAHLYEYYDLSQ